VEPAAKPRRWSVVRIDHAQWYVAHWMPHRKGAAWGYIQFRRVHAVAGVSGLQLDPASQARHGRWPS
jgi:hypothetical protein